MFSLIWLSLFFYHVSIKVFAGTYTYTNKMDDVEWLKKSLLSNNEIKYNNNPMNTSIILFENYNNMTCRVGYCVRRYT